MVLVALLFGPCKPSAQDALVCRNAKSETMELPVIDDRFGEILVKRVCVAKKTPPLGSHSQQV